MRCNPFWPICSAQILLLSTNSTVSWEKCALGLRMVNAAFPLSVRTVGLERMTLQSERVFIILCFSSNKLSSNYLMFYEMYCLKSQTLTSFDLFERRFSLTSSTIESPIIKHVPLGQVCDFVSLRGSFCGISVVLLTWIFIL